MIMVRFALAAVVIVITYRLYVYNETNHKEMVIAAVLAIIYCILLFTEQSVFNIPELMLFVLVGYFAFQKQNPNFQGKKEKLVVGIAVLIVSFLIGTTRYVNNFKSVDPIIGVKTYNVDITDEIVSIYLEDKYYSFKYRTWDGRKKQGTIPADKTSIIVIDTGENPYVERIETVPVVMDTNHTPAKPVYGEPSESFIICIPEGYTIKAYGGNLL